MTNRNILPYPYLPAEEVFDRIVASVGGYRVDSFLDGTPDWDNADYLLDNGFVIAELKELKADPLNDRETQERLSAMYSGWVQRGLVEPSYGKVLIQTDRLPETCQEEFFQLFKRRLEGPIAKASSQIRETKQRLGNSVSKGLLILVNEGNTMLRPDVAAFLLSRILNKQHTSINQVIFCTVNLPITGSDIPDQGRLWIPMSTDRPKVDAQLLQRMQVAWQRTIDEAIGLGPQPIINMDVIQNPLESFTYEANDIRLQESSFVKAGKYYSCKTTERKYYCDAVDQGLATMYLVESYTPNGDLIQAEFTQRLIWATKFQYEQIFDESEKKRLKKMMKKLRRIQS
jgi:hypothetical protein